LTNANGVSVLAIFNIQDPAAINVLKTDLARHDPSSTYCKIFLSNIGINRKAKREDIRSLIMGINVTRNIMDLVMVMLEVIWQCHTFL
jgi:hypothetical protein